MSKAKKSATSKESYKVIKKRSGRWSVRLDNGKFINGDAKVDILAAKGLIKATKKKEAPKAE
jgi:hypothetical protein